MNNMLPASWLKHLTIDEAQHYLSAGLIELTDYGPWVEDVADQAEDYKSKITYLEDELDELDELTKEKSDMIADLEEQLSAYER